MTECDEIADNIWRARSVRDGNGLNVTAPIRSYADAERVANHWLPDQGSTIRANVAEALFSKAKLRHAEVMIAEGHGDKPAVFPPVTT